jgi:hypothetical protein
MLLPPRYYGALSGPLVARTYDVAADGQRFMRLKSTEEGQGSPTPDLYLVQHWSADLQRRASAGR